jgi:hypothetical protein
MKWPMIPLTPLVHVRMKWPTIPLTPLNEAATRSITSVGRCRGGGGLKLNVLAI